jgi:hypothetical protein
MGWNKKIKRFWRAVTICTMKIIEYARCKHRNVGANEFDFGAAKRLCVSLGNRRTV